MNYVFYSHTDKGGRENNEDSFCVAQKDGAFLFAVADGLGGHECGEIASGIVTDTLKRKFESDPQSFSLCEAIKEANSAILKKQAETGKEMKTTVSAIFISGNEAVTANVGDTRLYLFSGDRIVFQTVDHSVSQLAVTVGEITADQIRNHQDRNKLTRALGVFEAIRVDEARFNTDDFNRVLICSDGFWEYVFENEMCQTVKLAESPDKWLNKMLKYHEKRVSGDNDNNTAIAVMKEENMV